MIKQQFCEEWMMRKKGEPAETACPVNLPHDAMIHEKRQANAEGGSAHGYFPGGIYLYEKRFFIPEDWKEKCIYLEFEGVYKNSVVSINGIEIGGRSYGYVPFIIRLDKGIKYGEENLLTVEVDNSKLPNSRWYTGSGIYRPVNLMIGNPTHIKYQGVKISTLSYAPARIRVAVNIEVEDMAKEQEIVIEIRDKENVVVRENISVNPQGSSEMDENSDITMELDIPDAKLWSDETPNLYECQVTLKENGKAVDEVTETFGIRMLSWNRNGLFVNGKETLLRGGCVHHDHGILGACSYEASEERRVRRLKEAGYNAIRSAHNPASEGMLRACDRLGMYVIDETWDTWYNKKSSHDYSIDFMEHYQEDIRAIIQRDYNYPSVIMYSIGNEISEPAEEKGVKLANEMKEIIHSMDDSRAVTAGINLMILLRSANGDAIYKDEGGIDDSRSKQAETMSSTMFNEMTSKIGTGMNMSANSEEADKITSPMLDSMDIAGYNYASGRYPLEGEAHPDRILYGSETFPQDIVKNWIMVKKYPYLIGDFMWTAWDYLGEAGIGTWAYTSDGKVFNKPYPWLLSDVGVMDILGNPNGELFLAQAVWGLLDRPQIAVQPVNHPGIEPAKSVWRGTNSIPYWSWRGCEGNAAIVEVYGDGTKAELILNGKSLGKNEVKDYKSVFEIEYQPGILEAVLYDEEDNEIGRNNLASSQGNLRIGLQSEKSEVFAREPVYIDLSIQDEKGITECACDQKITVTVTGGQLLAFGSANPRTEDEFVSGTYMTYYGKAQIVVMKDKPGMVTVKAVSEDMDEVKINIKVS